MMAQDGNTTTATTPHVLDVWKNTMLVSRGIIPYCTSDSDCVERFKEAIVMDNTTTAQGHSQLDALSKVIYCYAGVSVPEYYKNAVQHTAGGNNSLATPFFQSKVCTCDQSALFRGVRCEPNEYGMMLQGLFCLTGLWILGLLIGVIKLSFTQHLTSKTKQLLRATALLQYVAQLAWIAGTSQFRSIIGNRGVSDFLVDFGFVVSMFTEFAFATGMLLQTTAFLRGTMNKAAERRQKANLRRADGVFTVLPFALMVASTFLYFAEKLSIVMVMFSMAAIAVNVGFTVTARMLDKRIRRLLPKSYSGSETGQRRVAASAVPMDDSVRSLLESSRKIRTMTKALRNATARNVLAGVIYVGCRLFADVQRRWLVPLLFCVLQISFAHVPLIGVAGLSATCSIKTNLFNFWRVVPTRGGLKLAPELQQTSAAESSDCGTLGGS
jgi:hypothetical protein